VKVKSLKNKKLIEELARSSKPIKTLHFEIKKMRHPDENLLLVPIRKIFGNAVRRNRVRRLVKEFVRGLEKESVKNFLLMVRQTKKFSEKRPTFSEVAGELSVLKDWV